MKCPECVKEGKKSVVVEGGSRSTLVHCAPYYDEDGNYHYHDRNVTTTSMSCSNGHRWEHKFTGSCWCGWGKE